MSQIDMGRSLTDDKPINGKTNSFSPNDTIYASLLTDGTAPAATLKA